MARVQPVLPLGQYQNLRQQQQQALAAHKKYAEGLQQKQADVEIRKTDLDVAGKVLKVLSPTLPKPARQFLNTQLASYLGVNPKDEAFKSMNAMVMGLDPNSLQALSTTFSQQIEGASPGQIVEMTKGIMTGQVPIDQLLDQVDFSGGMGQEQLAGGEGQDQLQQQQKPKTAQPFQGGPGSVGSLAGERTVPPAMQQASPMLAGALGLKSSNRYRNQDLFNQGMRVPMDPKDQEKLANDIVTRSTGLSSSMSEMTNMVNLFEGRPQVLGPVGQLTRGVNTVVRQVEGFLQTVRPGAVVDDPDEYTQALARRAGQTIAKAHNLDQNAEDAARIEAMVLGLAYRMAAANNIPGNRLTNGIIQQNLRQLGASGSPEQFKAVLRDTIGATAREFDEYMQRTTGVSGYDVLARGVKDSDLKRFSQTGDLFPADVRQAMRQETFYRLNPDKRPQVTPASPTLDEEERTLGQLEMQEKERGIAKSDQEMDLAARRDTRAQGAELRAEGREDRMATAQERQAAIQADTLKFQREEAAIDNTRADRAQTRADSREERLVGAQEQSNTLQREQLDLTRANTEADNALQREKFDYEKQQDRVKADADRGAAIAKAFLEFGKAIAGIGGGGSVGAGGGVNVGGGGQDVGAFQLTPTPQRSFPQPRG
jgi:hypothetical protein